MLKPCRNPLKYGDNPLYADTLHANIIPHPHIFYSGKNIHFNNYQYGDKSTVNTGFPHTQNNALQRTRIAIFPFIYRTFTNYQPPKYTPEMGLKSLINAHTYNRG